MADNGHVVNDSLLGLDTERKIQEAKDFAANQLSQYQQLADMRLVTETQLFNRIRDLYIKHNGDQEAIHKAMLDAIANQRTKAEIDWTREESQIRLNASKATLTRDIRIMKERYGAEIAEMYRTLATKEEIDKRKKELDEERAKKEQELASVTARLEELQAEKAAEARNKRINKIISDSRKASDKWEQQQSEKDQDPDANTISIGPKGKGVEVSGKYIGKVKGFVGDMASSGKNVIRAAGDLGNALRDGDKTAISEAANALFDAAKPLLNAGQTILKNADEAKKKADESEKRAKKLDDAYNQMLEEGADENSEEMKALKAEVDKAKNQAAEDRKEADAIGRLAEQITKLQDDYQRNFDLAVEHLNTYQGSINARLQGSDKTYRKISDTISSNLMLNPFVKTTAVLEKVKEATDKGISYNVEQRAFLAGLSDKIAQTFDAFDSNLMRIIRLQQADSTANRLGMEAALTKLFNNMFEDSSYLSETADQVAAALVDAQSQMTNAGAAEFEYIVQKWLGALGSLGMGSDTLTQIATGLNYLATGDVTSLASNSSLQTMFAMAASNANLEYSELLLEGLDATKTNQLLQGMIEYLKEIADNSENQVVKSAYGDILNLSHSDMRALSNLTTAEIKTLGGNALSYENMGKELNTQFLQLFTRTTLPAMLTNVYDNVMYAMASDMVNNPVMFAMTKMLDWMQETETDIAIPFINAMGFGLDLNATVGDLMQMGLGIGQGLSIAGNILAGLGSMGGMNLDAASWNASETTKRGSGLNLTSLSTLGGTSGSIGTFAVNGNSSDTANSTMSSATDDAEESKKVTNKNSKPPEKTVEDVYKAIVGESAESYALVKDPVLESVNDSSRHALRVHIDGLSLLEGTIPVYDAALKAELTAQMDAIKLLMSAHQTIGVQKVKLVDGTVIQVQQETIAAAIKEVLFANEDKTFNNLIDTVENGSLKIDSVKQPVQVKNATGDKLQVSNLIW